MQQAKKTFMYGAVILSVAGAITKILGACFRIPLANWIGAEGMAYYNGAYPIYQLLLTIGTAGIPVAISRMVSERIAADNEGAANRVFKVSMVVMIIVGIVLSGALLLGADTFSSHIKKLNGSYYAMMAIAPALFFVPIMGTFRGYFQGMQNMKPTAVSQIVEQLFRVICGLALAHILLNAMGREYAAAGATFGATAGALFGLVTMIILYTKFKASKSYREKREEARKSREHKESARKIIKQLLYIAVPITIGVAIMPVMSMIDLLIVTDRLSASGFDAHSVRSLYGQLTGFAGPLINMPKVLTQAIAVSMVPTVVRAFKARDHDFLHYNVSLGMRFAMIIGLPCSVGIGVLSEPIMLLLYPNQPVDAVGAASCMTILAVGIVFLASIDTLSAVLQGVGKQMIPVVNIAIGALVKVVLTWTLTGIPIVNVKGAAIGTVSAYIVATILNYRAVKTYTGTKFDAKKTFLRPLIAVSVMGLVARGLYWIVTPLIGSVLATILSICAAGVIYVVMLFVTRSIKGEELKLLPKGEMLYGFYRRLLLTMPRKNGKMNRS
ncbi:MAG: polysaccharide biosynthesis protein [Clostridiales Family XIII bacterium]|jgi:stage V sporulation protein B|nr:polysaccharide biosynthesis protein [Clostridiales Family XIII bacterium]